MNLQSDFRCDLCNIGDCNQQNPEKTKSCENIWKNLPEDEKIRENISYIIIQGINLLSIFDMNNDLFKVGFDLIKNLSLDSLMDANACQKIALRVLGKCEAIALQPFVDLEALVGENAVITQATKISEGSFAKIYLVQAIAERTLPQHPKLVIKVPRTSRLGSRESLRSEINFLFKLHQSNKLTTQEKAALTPKPLIVTYKRKKILHTKTYVGFLTKLYEGGSLLDFIKNHPIPIGKKIDIAAQLIYKLSLLSKAGAIYLDIKMRNVLVNTETPQPTIDYIDFGDCYFADDPASFPKYGFAISEKNAMKDDIESLYLAAQSVKSEAALENRSNIYMSRALGLLLCEFFNSELVPFESTYSQQQLTDYLNKATPLSQLQQKYPGYSKIILQMLGTGGQPPLLPQTAWNEWCKAKL